MPKFVKSSPELAGRFRATLARLAAPDVTERQMFGYPCAWIGGNMVTGLFAEAWWVRVEGPDRAALLEMPGAHLFEPMAGRPMRAYVVLPAAVVGDETDLDAWVERAIACTRMLPPKG